VGSNREESLAARESAVAEPGQTAPL